MDWIRASQRGGPGCFFVGWLLLVLSHTNHVIQAQDLEVGDFLCKQGVTHMITKSWDRVIKSWKVTSHKVVGIGGWLTS
jgi:hypothetical protein